MCGDRVLRGRKGGFRCRQGGPTGSVLFPGRRAGCAVCLYGALKLKKPSCMDAEWFAAAVGLRHGRIALVEKGLPAYDVDVLTLPRDTR